MEADKLNTKRLTGPQKAAIFFLTMGEEYTTSFFKELDENSIKKIGKYMAEITYIPSDIIKTVMDDFLKNFKSDSNLVISGEEFLKEVVSKTLSKETAKEVFKVIGDKSKNTLFSDLADISVENLTNIIKGEHPQTIALIMTYLPCEKAAEILNILPEELKADIAFRILNIGQIDLDIVDELDGLIKKDISKIGMNTTSVDGINVLANILNEVDGDTEKSVLSLIENEDADLAGMIKQIMFVFEDLLEVDDRYFRDILQNVDNQLLAKALRTGTDEMKEKIMSNLSERASEMLKEDMEVMGMIKLSEVEQAQQDIIKTAKRLESEGRIVLTKGKDDVYV